MRLTRSLTETLIFGRGQTAVRYTQDSPILPEVWIRYAEEPREWQDLLLTPRFGFNSGRIAVELREIVELTRTQEQYEVARVSQGAWADWWRTETRCPANVAHNQAVAVARLYYDELIRVVLPLTNWWEYLWAGSIAAWREKNQRSASGDMQRGVEPTIELVLDGLRDELIGALDAFRDLSSHVEIDKSTETDAQEAIVAVPTDLTWFVQMVGSIFYALQESMDTEADPKMSPDECDEGPDSRRRKTRERTKHDEKVVRELNDLVSSDVLIDRARSLMSGLPIADLERRTGEVHHLYEPAVQTALEHDEPRVWLVNVNRPVSTAVSQSRKAIKADAAELLFEVDTSSITWAIIDSGVDAQHPAFLRRDGRGAVPTADRTKPETWEPWTRVERTYDFTRIRVLLDPIRVMNEDPARPLPSYVDEIKDLSQTNWEKFDELGVSLTRGRVVDWDILEPFLRVQHDASYKRPAKPHGTHVAGILGADWAAEGITGVCPQIRLWDLRVLEPGGTNDEFALLAALQFVRWINGQRDHFAVHGVNLSLSLHHDVANFACGRTPVCDEVESLIASGVVVVAAAGNSGYLKYRTGTGPASTLEETTPGYHTVSITDPGNADGAITVGSTHRSMPHTYGVSYFSSRGPTGDGRRKPDLVAPGEKIGSTFPNCGAQTMDGTSMAAPHVSGAAAMLMARYSELIGDPGRIKATLVDTATDLGREPYFQGSGMLDILRALQSI